MYKIVFVFLLAVSLCFGEPCKNETVDGFFFYEHVASLRSSSNNHFCGGIIITNRTILTTASCLKGRNVTNTIAVVGTYTLDEGGDRYQAERLIIHPDYNETLITNDIAIMIVNKTIKFKYEVQAIKMEYNDVKGCDDVYIAGWGTTSYFGELSNQLQMLQMKTTTVKQCREAYPDNIILKSQICAVVKPGGACHGDAGGPLVRLFNNKVVGIISWGNCVTDQPNVFTRISSFTTWIDANKV